MLQFLNQCLHGLMPKINFSGSPVWGGLGEVGGVGGVEGMGGVVILEGIFQDLVRSGVTVGLARVGMDFLASNTAFLVCFPCFLLSV